MLKRLNGTARSAGSSQAIALTSAMTTGGKGPRPASVEVTRRTYETRHQIDRVAG
jgi:hypothetical protein